MSERQILHLDLDAFFAAVEQRDDPRLRGQPVVVGGPLRRGVVAAASYEVRRFGVHSAMPLAEAVRRCPEVIVVPPRRDAYAAASEQVFAIFSRYTPSVEGLSIDEAFLDVTHSRALFGDGVAIARAIKEAVRRETGLTVSAGVAPNKFVAKIASDLEKPDGLVVVTPDAVPTFLAPLPIARMWGVGPKAAERLRALGLSTIGDLAAATPATLRDLLGSWGETVHALAHGIDEREVEPFVPAKSVGAEETFDQDLTHRDEIERALLGQAQRVAGRLWHEQSSGRTVMIKIKYSDFRLTTRRTGTGEPICDTDSIFRVACRLLDAVPLAGRRVRLTGVALFDLSVGPPPPSLFPDPEKKKRQQVEAVVNTIRERFGDELVTRARLLEPPPARKRR